MMMSTIHNSTASGDSVAPESGSEDDNSVENPVEPTELPTTLPLVEAPDEPTELLTTLPPAAAPVEPTELLTTLPLGAAPVEQTELPTTLPLVAAPAQRTQLPIMLALAAPGISDGEMTTAAELAGTSMIVAAPVTDDGDDDGDDAEMTIAANVAGTSTTVATPATDDGEMTIAARLAGIKRKRNLPGTPDPDSQVVALSPKTLMATHKFTCEVCARGFQREQNLQLHKRGHNLPGTLKPRENKDKEVRKKVYVCPEATCVHHDPSRALGDLTGIKKHFCRKHGEKKWQCEKCSKKYAVLSDWKAHSKTCGTRDYKCECGSIFHRRDSFLTHKAFCDELAEESARLAAGPPAEPQIVEYAAKGSS